MDFSKLFKNITKEMGSGLTSKIGNPPKLNVKPCFCMWSDLLGFSNILCGLPMGTLQPFQYRGFSGNRLYTCPLRQIQVYRLRPEAWKEWRGLYRPHEGGHFHYLYAEIALDYIIFYITKKEYQ